jgi:hypothetical protein
VPDEMCTPSYRFPSPLVKGNSMSAEKDGMAPLGSTGLRVLCKSSTEPTVLIPVYTRSGASTRYVYPKQIERLSKESVKKLLHVQPADLDDSTLNDS